MAGYWKVFGCIIIGILITRTQSTEENYHELPAGAIITHGQSLKKIEVRKTSNFTSTLLPTPTVIQQGNNIFIKPRITVGSAITSIKQGDLEAQGVSLKSKVSGEETSIVIGKPETPQMPTIAVLPPTIIPTSVEGDISIFPPRIPHRPQIPTAVPSDCQSMQCLPNIFPMSPYFPHVSRFPIIVQKPVRPTVIPNPPQLPPIILPKLPVQVIVQRPIIPVLDHPMIVPSICPPMIRCIPTEKDLPTGPDVFKDIFQKFRNLLTVSSNIDLTSFFVPDEQISTGKPLTFPTLCAQGIIAERFVPNIVRDDKVKLFMSPIFITTDHH